MIRLLAALLLLVPSLCSAATLGKTTLDTRELERISAVLNRAQQGQRLAKGLSVGGETEEAIRAQSQAEVRRLIDVFIDSVKENVSDEEIRERIRRAIVGALPEEEGAGAGDAGDEIAE